MALDTVLLSYCIDAEENKGTALFAPPALVEGLNAFTERQEALEQARDFRKYRTYEDDHYDHDHERDEKNERNDTSDDDSSWELYGLSNGNLIAYISWTEHWLSFTVCWSTRNS